MASPNPSVSVVFPCYRDEGNIGELVSRIDTVFAELGMSYEIVCVNDASPDGSRGILTALAARRPDFRVVTHSRNFGKMAAIDTGMRLAKGDAVIYLDGDLQDPPELIPEMVRLWQQGSLVVCTRIRRRQGSWLVKVLSRCFYWTWKKVTHFDLPLNAGDFSLLDRRVVDLINALPERDRFFRGLRAWLGFTPAYVEFDRPERFSGRSTQSLIGYFSWAIMAISSFSFFPLRMITWVALAASSVLFAYLVLVLGLYINGIKGPPGFATLIGCIVFGFTVVLLCLAVISEYLVILLTEMKRRPTSVVEEILESKSTP